MSIGPEKSLRRGVNLPGTAAGYFHLKGPWWPRAICSPPAPLSTPLHPPRIKAIVGREHRSVSTPTDKTNPSERNRVWIASRVGNSDLNLVLTRFF